MSIKAKRWSLTPKFISYTLVTIYFLGWSLKDVIIKTNLAFVDSATLSMVVSLSALITAFCVLQVKRVWRNLDRGGRGAERRTRNDARTEASTTSLTLSVLRDPNPRVLFKIVLLNICMGSALYLSTVAVDLLGPFNGAVIDVVIYPICLTLIARFLLHERASRTFFYGLAISICGFGIFYYDTFYVTDSLTLLSILAIASASFSYASVLSLIKSLLNDGLSPEMIVFCRFLLLGALALYILPQTLQPLPVGVWISLILLGMLCYTLLSTLLFYGLKGVSATIISIFVAAGPLFSAIFTWLLIPGTTYTLIQGAGLAVIVGGLLFTMLVKPFGARRREDGE